ncbi:MAG: sigma 54-interacting transcriptional regulator [Deferrisomatales bacterium]|nr:sigma 54-interacting transcriptional regulator [Deferrisomatales bacterium]
MSAAPVLVTWVAVNNDPFERDHETGDPRMGVGGFVPGPTLTLLCDDESTYCGRITDVVLLHRSPDNRATGREQRALQELTSALRDRSFRVHAEAWDGDDPTDHRGVFEFLRDKLPELRRQFPGRELVLHISPGTPSMQTIWVLMAETGFIEPPFTVVKSYRRAERRGRPAIVPVELGIETFYKVYKSSRPLQVGSEDQVVIWDPRRFRTDAMKRVFTEARRFAQLKVPVLIRGERGTGKTTLANWIRSNSPFKRDEQDDRWPSVACGQYSPETMRAELFGYKKGAFTGATSDRSGLLEAAHRDTLFLDEVGDVSPDLQRLLIRAIEEKRYFALGDDAPRESDFRLLTATNIDDRELRTRIAPDFLDRISLLSVTLPPLRDVPDEIPWLWEAVYSAAAGRAGVTKSRAALSDQHHAKVVVSLGRHPLPGNLRDLFRVAYRILAARNDAGDPMSPADAVAYGIESITGPAGTTTVSMSRTVAAAFAHGAVIDDVVAANGTLCTADVLADFKAFLANELRRIGSQSGAKACDLCDVSERSLREWAKTQTTRKNSAGARKPAAECEGP